MQTVDSLFLFKALIKVGCSWHGDVSHRKWSERLHFSEDIEPLVRKVLEPFQEGNDYKIEDGYLLWIA